MERIKTHIKGFDKLVDGGFPKNSIVVINGQAGCGKTIFSTEFIHNGAKVDEDIGVYFTFEEKKGSLFEQAKQFGWDLEKLEKFNKVKIISIGVEEINKSIVDELIEIVKKVKAKRVVIDSINTLAFLTPTQGDSNEADINSKKFIYYFITRFKEVKDLTTILISQKGDKKISNLVEYLADGVIDIEYESLGGDYSRNLTIKKMRKTKNDEDLHPLEVSKKGIIIHDLD